MKHNHRKKRRTPEPRDEVDLILRHVSRQFPTEVARALLPTGQPIEPLCWVDTQVTSRQRRLDRALWVKAGERRTVLHVEWALRMTGDVPLRAFEYNSLTALALAAEARAEGRGKPPPPIESVVVLLTGRTQAWSAHGEYCTSSPNEPFSGVHFRIEPVYQRTVAELAARGAFWSIFAPLAADADKDKLAQVLERLRAETTPGDFEELAVAMAVLAGADQRKRAFGDVVRSLLPRELVMQNWIFREGKAAGIKAGRTKGRKEGLAEGRQEGLTEGRKEGRKEGLTEGREKGRLESFESFAHQFERRLSRPLMTAERKRLKERLRAEGPIKVGDVILDLSAAELAAWLAPSNGHRT